jgi:hypothetical protein
MIQTGETLTSASLQICDTAEKIDTEQDCSFSPAEAWI